MNARTRIASGVTLRGVRRLRHFSRYYVEALALAEALQTSDVVPPPLREQFVRDVAKNTQSIVARLCYVRNQADREAVWIDLIRKLVPETTVAEARLLVAAAISFIEDVARTWHLTRYAGVADEITEIALSIVTSRS